MIRQEVQFSKRQEAWFSLFLQQGLPVGKQIKFIREYTFPWDVESEINEVVPL